MALLKHEREGTEAQQTSTENTRTRRRHPASSSPFCSARFSCYRENDEANDGVVVYYALQILITQKQIHHYHMILDCRLFIWDYEATARCVSDSTTAGQQTGAVTSSLS